MPSLDLNLLVALDVLLSEGSVVRAAERMHLSPPAMSRTLARIRHLLGDPILVRAGRGLVPTPRAEALRERLRLLIEDAHSLVRADPSLDLAALDRIFTIRANDGLVGAFGARMAASMLMVAPRVRLRFVPEGDEDVGALRDGRIDLDIGAMGGDGPELRVQTLFQDRFVGIVRSGHHLAGGNVTAEQLAAEIHVATSRRGRFQGPLDRALAAAGLQRRVAIVVSSFAEALAILRESNMVGVLPDRLTASVRMGLTAFALPIDTGTIAMALAWHPRFEADAAHRWLREQVRAVCGGGEAPPPSPL